MKVIVIVGVLFLVGLTLADPVLHPRGCKWILGKFCPRPFSSNRYKQLAGAPRSVCQLEILTREPFTHCHFSLLNFKAVRCVERVHGARGSGDGACPAGNGVRSCVDISLACVVHWLVSVGGCEEGTYSYMPKGGCGYLTREATCDNPTPEEDRRGKICDFSACYCAPPTVRDTVTNKCVKLEDCPKEAQTEEQ